MKRNLLAVSGIVLTLAMVWLASPAHGQRYLRGVVWPEPPVIKPGEGNGPPSDAIVLFDGKNFDAWQGANNWKVDEDGGFTVKGPLQSKQGFGDCQLHIEFMCPSPPRGEGQGRGNNGVGLMGARYEIQILDSYENKTYPEGQCGALYNQKPPMVNASRKPGEWQTYDIFFTAPRFGEDGKVTRPAFITVLHNGVLVHNNVEVTGPTHYDRPPVYAKHRDKEPLVLYYHGDPVRFRNIWVREPKDLSGKKGKVGPES